MPVASNNMPAKDYFLCGQLILAQAQSTKHYFKTLLNYYYFVITFYPRKYS